MKKGCEVGQEIDEPDGYGRGMEINRWSSRSPFDHHSFIIKVTGSLPLGYQGRRSQVAGRRLQVRSSRWPFAPTGRQVDQRLHLPSSVPLGQPSLSPSRSPRLAGFPHHKGPPVFSFRPSLSTSLLDAKHHREGGGQTESVKVW